MARDLDGSFQTAQRLNVTNRSLTLNGTIGNADRLDFYRINFTRRSGLAFTLSQLKANADIALFNGSKQMIQQSNRPKKSDEAIATSLDPGTYYIRIVPRSKQDNTRYKLSLFCSDLAISPASGSNALAMTNNGISSNSVPIATNATTTQVTTATNTTSTTTNPATATNSGSFILTPKTLEEIKKMKLGYMLTAGHPIKLGIPKNNVQQLSLYWQRLFNSTLSGT